MLLAAIEAPMCGMNLFVADFPLEAGSLGMLLRKQTLTKPSNQYFAAHQADIHRGKTLFYGVMLLRPSSSI